MESYGLQEVWRKDKKKILEDIEGDGYHRAWRAYVKTWVRTFLGMLEENKGWIYVFGVNFAWGDCQNHVGQQNFIKASKKNGSRWKMHKTFSLFLDKFVKN